jgi:hypothetical protein
MDRAQMVIVLPIPIRNMEMENRRFISRMVNRSTMASAPTNIITKVKPSKLKVNQFTFAVINRLNRLIVGFSRVLADWKLDWQWNKSTGCRSIWSGALIATLLLANFAISSEVKSCSCYLPLPFLDYCALIAG